MKEPGGVYAAIANDARRLADHVENLPDRMRTFLDADPKPDAAEVRKELDPSKLSFDAFGIYNLIELRWSPDHAKTFISRIIHLEDGVKTFLTAYAVTLDSAAGMAFNRLELGTFLVVAKLTAQNIRLWADAIENLPPSSKEPAAEPSELAELRSGVKKLLSLAGDFDEVECRIRAHLEKENQPAQGAMLRALNSPGEWMTCGVSDSRFRQVRNVLVEEIPAAAKRFTATKAGEGCRIVYTRPVERPARP